MNEKLKRFIGLGTPLEKARDKFARELRNISDKDKRKELLESKEAQNLKFDWSVEKLNQFLENIPKLSPENILIIQKIFKNILESCIKAGRLSSVNEIIERISSNTDTKNFLNFDLAKTFVETKNSRLLLNNIQSFKDINFTELAELMIKSKQTNELFHFLNIRININAEELKKLVELALENKEFAPIISNYYHLKQKVNINIVEIMKSYLLESEDSDSKVILIGLTSLEDKNKSLNGEFLILLIQRGYSEEALNNIAKFNIDENQIQTILEEIIISGKSKNLNEILKNYELSPFILSNVRLNIDFAYELIKQGNSEFVLNYRGIFSNFQENLNQLLLEVVNKGGGKSLINHINEFNNLDFSIAEILISRGFYKETNEFISKFNYKTPEAVNFILSNVIFFEILSKDKQKELILLIDSKITIKEEVKKILGVSILKNNILDFYFNNQDLLGIKQQELFELALNNSLLGVIIESIEKFTEVNPDVLEQIKIASKMFGKNLNVDTFNYTLQISQDNLDKETILVISNLIISNNLQSYFENPEFFKRFPPQLIYEQFMRLISNSNSVSNNAIFLFVSNLEKFPNSNAQKITKILIQNGYFDALILSMEILQVDQNMLYKELLRTNNLNLFFSSASKFDKIDSKIFKTLKIARSIFGYFISQEVFLLCERILEGKLSESEKKRLKINLTGEAGIQQLIATLNLFKKEMLEQIINNEEVIVDFLISNPELSGKAMSYLRYDRAEWYRGSSSDFINKLKEFRNINVNRRLKPEYSRSGKVEISSTRESKEVELTIEASTRLNILKESIAQALEMINKNEIENYSLLINEFTEIKNLLLINLESKLKLIVDNPKAIEYLSNIIQNLKEINLPSKAEGNLINFLLENFENIFLSLSQYEEFHPFLRKIAYFITFKKHFEEYLKIKDLIDRDELSIETINKFIFFDDKVQELFNIFKNKNSSKSFRKITSTKALTDEQERIRKLIREQEGFQKTPFEFIPTRGLLMEFSGQIADACWGNASKSIAGEFPNFTSIIIVQNPGAKFEKLAGAYFLIETEGEDGTPLLVIRGLNPIENVINKTDINEFMEETFKYVKSIADKMGRKIAIVIDERANASTNRKAISEYLLEIQPKLKKIIIRSDNTEFNKRPITNKTYLIEGI